MHYKIAHFSPLDLPKSKQIPLSPPNWNDIFSHDQAFRPYYITSKQQKASQNSHKRGIGI